MEGWLAAPHNRLFAWHLALLAGTLFFLGPTSTLWAFWAETAGLTVAWFILAAAGRLPFSAHAYYSLPFVLVGFFLVQALSWFAAFPPQPPPAQGFLWPRLDQETLLGLALGLASTVVWVASPTGALERPRWPGPMRVVGEAPARRSYPSPFLRVLVFDAAWFASLAIAGVAQAFTIPVFMAFGGEGARALALSPIYAMAVLVGVAQLVLDRRARARPALGPAPAGPHCPNCHSKSLLRARNRFGQAYATCIRCGSMVRGASPRA